MTPEQIDAAQDHEQDEREFARLMAQLSAAIDGNAWDETGRPITVDTAAQGAVLQWEMMR